ncbi:MAG: hypothetical protein KC996_08345 [Phycisphaerales bacterium]|nr:hypothetical protein [Phycisphaerales bacterium]
MKTTTNRNLRTAAALSAAALTMTLVGCSSGNSMHAGDIDSIRSNPSPSMHTLARRSSDRDNDYATMRDTNLRMISNDIDKLLLYTDRPSHLSSFPDKH